jgi:DNA-binding transcriptional LysR family regulator
MLDLNLARLRTFADVVELGSFSAAAERAGISQPAVSLQIRQLERSLGLRLVERVGRRTQPTPAGRDLFQHIPRIRGEIAHALDAIAPYRDGAVDRIRIGTGATACIYLLPPILGRLKEKMPGLDITVQTGNTPDIMREVEANELDIAVVTLPAPGRAFQVTEVYRDELVAVHRPEGGDARPVGAGFLSGEPLLFHDTGSNTRRLTDDWFSASGKAPRPLMELGSVEAIKRLVSAGLGWSVLPKLAVAEDEAAGNLAVHSLSPRLFRTLGAAIRQDKRLGRGLRELVEALRVWEGPAA